MKINEIFYSLQGEGHFTGRAAVFIRLAGCNLKCPFCDTDFHNYTEMTELEIVDAVTALNKECRFVVITGGEPTIQDCTQLISFLHLEGYVVAMESNGTHKPPFNVDWLTISPKTRFTTHAEIHVHKCNELKLVFDGENTPEDFGVLAEEYYLQPCDTGNAAENGKIINDCLNYIKENPKWRMSLQTQKILKVR